MADPPSMGRPRSMSLWAALSSNACPILPGTGLWADFCGSLSLDCVLGTSICFSQKSVQQFKAKFSTQVGKTLQSKCGKQLL